MSWTILWVMWNFIWWVKKNARTVICGYLWRFYLQAEYFGELSKDITWMPVQLYFADLNLGEATIVRAYHVSWVSCWSYWSWCPIWSLNKINQKQPEWLMHFMCFSTHALPQLATLELSLTIQLNIHSISSFITEKQCQPLHSISLQSQK